MNAELYQICSILAASKKAMKSGGQFQNTPISYVNTTEFAFLPQGKWFSKKQYTAKNIADWFDKISSKDLEALKLFCPVVVKDRSLLGFSNATESAILCFFKSDTVTYFVPNWQFDPETSKWNILYTEFEFKSSDHSIPSYENNRDSFREILTKIGDFALKIDCPEFSERFFSAQRLLDGEGDQGKQMDIEFLDMPEEQLRLFKAADLADVFGAMGSWNDHPWALAQEKGLFDEYNQLSDELLENIRLALLYALNEW